MRVVLGNSIEGDVLHKGLVITVLCAHPLTWRVTEWLSSVCLFNIWWGWLSPSSIRWSATSACLKAVHGRTARQETCGHTRRHTGASTRLCVISRAVERPFSPLTASRSTSVSTPRKSRSSAMCKAVRRRSTRCTGECTLCEQMWFCSYKKTLPLKSLVLVALVMILGGRSWILDLLMEHVSCMTRW